MNELPDHLMQEFLLRLPPADPACLARAAAVCRRWRRLIADRAFRRRFRELHRHLPTLGFFHHCLRNGVYSTHFMPASSSSSFRPPHADVHAHWTPLDARHGRVLFHDTLTVVTRLWSFPLRENLVVRSPITGDSRSLPMPPTTRALSHRWGAVVLCTAAGCDHVDCHCNDGPFVVVSVVTNESHSSTSAFVYSSDTRTWRVTTSIVEHQLGFVVRRRSVLAGNALYLEFLHHNRIDRPKILEYDLGKQELSFIDLPTLPNEPSPTFLLVENGGRLGVAVAVRSKVYMWSRETSFQNGRGWAQNRVIDLERFLPGVSVCTATTPTSILAFVDSIDVLSVKIPYTRSVFNLHIKSGVVTNIGEYDGCTILPYTTFYIPSVRSSLKGRDCDGLREGAPSA